VNVIRFPFWILLVALVGGCAGFHTKTPDPLAGWKGDFNEQPNQVIVTDYQNYIQKLSPEERKFSRISDWLEDGKGQHAIKIEIALNGTWWEHVLIYDKENKRIKTIKYSSGGYRS
jgi:hypothetical protein